MLRFVLLVSRTYFELDEHICDVGTSALLGVLRVHLQILQEVLVERDESIDLQEVEELDDLAVRVKFSRQDSHHFQEPLDVV